MKIETINNIKKSLASKKGWCLVVGDLMLDHYIFGHISRISPEAPVPILKKSEEQYRLGGAGNVAANLRGFGIKTTIVGCLGKDKNGLILEELLKEKQISTSYIIKTNNKTTTKSRVLGGQQQILRIDDEIIFSIDENQVNKKISFLMKKNPSVIILSDYGKGVLNQKIIQNINKLAKKKNIIVIADPKGNSIEKYKNINILTPNKKEAIALVREESLSEDKFDSKLQALSRKHKIDYIAMTQGHLGIKLIKKNTTSIIPATKLKYVYDVSGAGDTVIASIAAGLIAGLNIHDALELANQAAGHVISKVGTSAIELNDLIEVIKKENLEQSKKIMSPIELEKKVFTLKKQKMNVGFTNGCFDILHAGHVMYLEKARNKVDYLILALNSDISVKKLKGSSRPVINQNDRARVLSALEAVDAIVIFNDTTPLKLIKKLQPNTLIKGDDYKINQVVGSKEVKSWGGKTELIPILEGKSSTKIIKKIS